MVTTTVSGAGWATSMLPPPVWVNPCRSGTTRPCRDPNVIVTVGAGGAGGWAGAGGRAPPATSRPIRQRPSAAGVCLLVMGFLPSLALPPQDEVGGGSQQTVLVLDRARVGV